MFYNHPTAPACTASRLPAARAGRSTSTSPRCPTDVDLVRLVTSLDDGGKVFGQVGQPVARVADAGGTPLVEFAMTGLDRESIVVAVELYRRNGAWKVRAVGQGYDGGLAALLADHGVDATDDAPAAAPAAPAPGPGPGRRRARPAAARVTRAPADPPPPSGAGPAPPPPAAPVADVPAAARARRAAGPRCLPRPPLRRARGVNLTKGRPVSLVKGQSVNLVKDGNQRLTMVRMGLGWDAVRKSGRFGSREVDVDLDATAVLFAGTEAVDLAFYNNLKTKDGSVVHQWATTAPARATATTRSCSST